MLAAIAGDIIGSVHERAGLKTTEFPLLTPHSRFTDDTVLTLAVADSLLHGRPYADALRAWGRRFPNAGYGGMFRHWLENSAIGPYNSFGNGSAMRVSPIGWAFDDEERVLAEAARSAEVTHDHPEGVRGAQAIALAVLLARRGMAAPRLREELQRRFGYDLGRTVAEIRPTYKFDVTCQGSVPEAIIAALESRDVEDAIRLAISLGGDADTLACMAGAVAEALHGGAPAHLVEVVKSRLPPELWRLVDEFCARYGVPR